MVKTTMLRDETVLYGPKEETFPAAGSVYRGEAVTALWREGDWCCLEYTVTTTGKRKRGYVPLSSLKDTAGLPDISAQVTAAAGGRFVQQASTIFFGPREEQFPKAGEVYAGESVFYLGLKENGYAFVECGGSREKKRGWILADHLGTAALPSLPAGYRTFQAGDTIPAGLPLAGARITQGFNDKTTRLKGHLGCDLVGFSGVRPLFDGTVVGVQNTTTRPNGRTVCLSHRENGTVFYSTYCHLKSIASGIRPGAAVTTATVLGTIGGSGYGKESYYGTHLHVCVYTGKPTNNPMGYCKKGGSATFEAVSKSANPFYYGDDEKAFPRCGGVRFYDPYGVITSGGAVLKQYP